MKMPNKTIVSLLLILNFCTATYAMQKPLDQQERSIIKKTLNIMLNGGSNQIHLHKSPAELAHLAVLAERALNDTASLNDYNNRLKMTIPQIKSLLNQIIQITSSYKNVPQHSSYSNALPPALRKDERKALKKALNFEINTGGGNQFYTSKSSDKLNKLIVLAEDALTDKASLNVYSNEFKTNISQIKSLLNQIIQKANSFLSKGKKPVIQQTPIITSPAPSPTTTPIITVPVASSVAPTIPSIEMLIEEIEPNQLYIGLDIKDVDAKGQKILWQESINYMNSKMSEGSQFIPNDYFHITIAWYESKDPISKETIAKVEHALAHATEILRIVYPTGIIDVSLLDKAVLLGRKKNTVAYRVAESSELKKLQDILLKFISFEDIKGFKFSTFALETPLHATLGRIQPAKAGKTFQAVVENLNAPTGTRASKGESFKSSTFRLTYSAAGKAWQELMSYSF